MRRNLSKSKKLAPIRGEGSIAPRYSL